MNMNVCVGDYYLGHLKMYTFKGNVTMDIENTNSIQY